MIVLSHALGLLCALVILFGGVTSAHAVARELARDAPPAVRLCATFVCAAWLYCAAFILFAAAGLFRAPIVALAFALMGGLARWRACTTLGPTLRGDLRTVLIFVRARLSSFEGVLLCAALFIVAARTMRGMVAPALGWDALTYHLVTAARWVQAGGFVVDPFPDAWTYYRHFPYLGEVPYGFALLAQHGDALVAPVGVLLWLALLGAAYALARSFGAGQRTALLAALAVALIPGIVNQLTAGYVDLWCLALFLASALFLRRSLVPGQSREGWLSLGAAALCAGSRWQYAVLLAAVLAAFVLVLARERPLRARRLCVALLGAVALIAPGATPYLQTWWATGDPAYPFALFGQGNEYFSLLQGDRFFPDSTESIAAFVAGLVAPHRLHQGIEHLNFGPVVPLAFLAGLVAAVRLWRQSVARLPIAYLALSALVFLAPLFTDAAWSLRVIWGDVTARMLAPGVAGFVLLVAVSPLRASFVLLALCASAGLATALPLGWSREDLAALAALAPWLAALGALVFAARLVARRSALAGLLIALCGTCLFAIPWHDVRSEARAPIYRAAALGRAYDYHPLERRYAAAALWEHLDGARPLRIALSAGFEAAGHNWYRYPLLGSRLQNEVLHVPASQGGTTIDYWRAGQFEARASESAWLARLRAERIEVVVMLSPAPPERRFIEAHPERFRLIAATPDGENRAYEHRVSPREEDPIRR